MPNRAAFNDALSAPAAASERAVLFLDVNGFKRINDSIGHAAGDEVIASVARRLEGLAGPGCLLARIGGDEFVFVVTGANAGHRAEWLAHAAERALAQPFAAAGRQVSVYAAMGHAVQASDDMTGDDLVRQADLAMYEVKRRSARRPVAFAEVAGQDPETLEAALRAALDRPGELWIAYRPLVAATDGTLAWADALPRCTSAELRLLPPDRLLALAEQAGLSEELDQRLLDILCDDLAANPDCG